MLPTYYLKQKATGSRCGWLKKKPTKYEAAPKTEIIIYPGRTEALGAKKSDLLLFGKEEYQWWIKATVGHQIDMEIAVCRACGARVFSKVGRVKHFEENPKCRSVLTKIYRELRHSSGCVVCGDTQKKRQFGVALCRGLCTERWLHSEQRPERFVMKLREAGVAQTVFRGGFGI